MRYRAPAFFFLTALTARAVILFDVNPVNTAEPTGPNYASSGWQYEGTWGGFLGTPIAPSFFISAAHIGQQSSVLTFGGVDYPVVRAFGLRLGFDGNNNPLYSDLIIWQIEGQFSSFAPCYEKNNEIGHRLIVIGRGTERGDEIFRDGTRRGWEWGAGLGIRRWGENIVTDIAALGPLNNDAIYAQFDESGLPFEAHLSSGDSGGAVFIEDKGIWKLAGINYAVDGPFYPGPSSNGGFFAALYNARGFYYQDGANFVQITTPNPAPTGFYASRIASRLDWIYGVIDPTGDLDNDGIANLAEHGLKLQPLVPDAAERPQIGREGQFLTLTYRKNLAQADLVFAVEKSTDLVAWQTAQTQDEITPIADDLQVVKAKVAIGTAPRLFLRLRVTRP